MVIIYPILLYKVIMSQTIIAFAKLNKTKLQFMLFRPLLLLLGICFAQVLTAQSIKQETLQHSDYSIWKTINNTQISNNGRWVVYELYPENGDGKLVVYDGNLSKDYYFERGKEGKLTENSQFLVFKIKPHQDSLQAMRRRKVKSENLPKDTLAILNLDNKQITKIAEVRDFQLPKKWNDWLAYQKEPLMKVDTTQKIADEKPKKKKKEGKDNGSTLVIKQLTTNNEYRIEYVKQFTYSEEGTKFAAFSSGDDFELQPGVYVFDVNNPIWQPIWQQKGDYAKMTFDKKGTQLAFIADVDTTKARIRPFGLYIWQEGQTTAKLTADQNSEFLSKDWQISKHSNLRFSKDTNRLLFGIAPTPILADTTLLEEEVAKVEVWAYDEPILHTIQNVRLKQEQERNYDCVLHLDNGKIVQLATSKIPEVRFGEDDNATIALGYNLLPYSLESTWEWWNKRDVYLIEVENGKSWLIGEGIEGNTLLSPSGKYVYWYSLPDSAWFAHSIEKGTRQKMTNNKTVKFFNELDDVPNEPYPYGIAGWMKEDEALLVYDRYDIWKIDPLGEIAPTRLTNGRKKQQRFRVISYEEEKRFFEPNDTLLLSIFEESSKHSGYAFLQFANNELNITQFGAYAFSNRVLRAKNAARWVFTKENFQVFPDLLYSKDLKTGQQISNANPQQKDYAWGSIELVKWTSLDGEPLQGLLVKPANFDPKKQYPMIVNFYERSSDGLYQHRAPFPNRSQINYAYYASRGYVIFNPDISYRIGYPGESAFNAVMSGTTYIIDKGFVDKERIALQGHSWGGYQIAYILTRTNLFRCAESGAPVVNMFSAYGGIRWESGLSRAGQYERTQSRIGGSIWEYPLRYIENSPIFAADKITTPVLIMHNDKDGAVPWYQGIEFFIAMRRLGKPAWLLNYNDEPHWPVKRANRLDFQLRMEQFFDHYLMNAPKPKWMERGVPALEKGIEQGYQLLMPSSSN